MAFAELEALVKLASSTEQLTAARKETDTNPTEAQREAGNYRKGHVRIHGLDISIENPKGSTRSGTDKSGKAWSVKLKHDYGYIRRTEGRDGDHVDVFVGPDADSGTVFVVNQVDPDTGKFNEHKCMLAFRDEAAAREGYLANYEAGWQGLGSVRSMTVEEFKEWLRDGDQQKQATLADVWQDTLSIDVNANSPPVWQKALQSQLTRPTWPADGSVLQGIAGNLQQAHQRGQEMVSEQDAVEDLKSDLVPGYRLARAQRFLHHGDRLQDPVDRMLFRGTL